jgi:hypothetical protein
MNFYVNIMLLSIWIMLFTISYQLGSILDKL